MRETGRTQRVATISNWVVFPIIAVASVVLLALDPIRVSQTVGVVPIFALWMAIVALLVGLLARLSIFAIPVLGLVLMLCRRHRGLQACGQPRVPPGGPAGRAQGDRRSLPGLAGIAQGSCGLRHRAAAVSGLHRCGRRRWPLRRQSGRAVPHPHAGPVSGLCPSLFAVSSRVRRKLGHGGFRRPDGRAGPGGRA